MYVQPELATATASHSHSKPEHKPVITKGVWNVLVFSFCTARQESRKLSIFNINLHALWNITLQLRNHIHDLEWVTAFDGFRIIGCHKTRCVGFTSSSSRLHVVQNLMLQSINLSCHLQLCITMLRRCITHQKIIWCERWHYFLPIYDCSDMDF